jgi:hypothetical protein
MVERRAEVHLERAEPQRALALLSTVRPVVEARGGPAQKHLFYRNSAWPRASEARYRIDDETIADARRAVAAASESGYDSLSTVGACASVAWARCWLGDLLMARGDLEEAQKQLETSLTGAERNGDIFLQAATACCLAMTALRRHDVEAVRSLAPLALARAEMAGIPEWQGVTKACLAWLAWQDRRVEEVPPTPRS